MLKFPSTAGPLAAAHLERLQESLERHDEHKKAFYDRTAELREKLLEEIRSARDALLREMFILAGLDGPESGALGEIAEEIRRYNRFCDWAVFDLVALAACLPFLHAFRIGDDVVDDHEDYKRGAPTALGNLRRSVAVRDAAQVANLLSCFMMVFEAAGRLDLGDRRLALHTLAGALRESLPAARRTLADYRRMVDGKMVCYAFLIYRPAVERLAVPAATRAAFERFLKRSFFLAQIANDLVDLEDDQARRQPNYWTLPWEPGRAAAEFLSRLGWLSDACRRFEGDLGDYAHSRVADLLRYTLQVSEEDRED
jgi:geranylgeranyl pyrophosphate synthase